MAQLLRHPWQLQSCGELRISPSPQPSPCKGEGADPGSAPSPFWGMTALVTWLPLPPRERAGVRVNGGAAQTSLAASNLWRVTHFTLTPALSLKGRGSRPRERSLSLSGNDSACDLAPSPSQGEGWGEGKWHSCSDILGSFKTVARTAFHPHPSPLPEREREQTQGALPLPLGE